MKNYHKILGVTKDSSDEEIKKAFRDLAKRYHPDVNKDANAENKFKEINEAYNHIINKKEDEPQFSNNSSFYHQIHRQIQPDIHMQFDIEFMEACHGAEKTVSFQYHAPCKKCEEHKRVHDKYNIKYCVTCKGAGFIRIQNGPFNIGVPCPQCGGQGSVLECDGCNGQGNVVDKKEITIKVPSGADTGKILRIQGHGNYDYKSETYGNLFFHIQVINNTNFTRQDENIFSEKHLDYLDCLLGGMFKIQGIHGETELFVPECTEDGKVLKINNQGINHVGHQYVTIKINIPKTLDKRTKKVLINLKKLNKK